MLHIFEGLKISFVDIIRASADIYEQYNAIIFECLSLEYLHACLYHLPPRVKQKNTYVIESEALILIFMLVDFSYLSSH